MNHLFVRLKSSTEIALILLIGVTAVWGWTFISVKDAVLKMPVMDFLAIRFSIAAVTLILLRPQVVSRISQRQLWHGTILGVMLGSAYITQTFGLQITSPATAGFITGMAVVLTPVMAWLLVQEKIKPLAWVAVGLATIGLALLSLHGWVFGKGEFLVLICAFCLAGHITGLGKWSSSYETYGLALVQIIIAAIVCLAAAVPGGLVAPPDFTVWTTIFITAILATSIAFIVQTWAQKLISSTQAAVVLTMEPVFAGIFAATIGGEVLTLRTIVGAVCVITAMLIIQLRAGSGTMAVHEP